MIVNVSFPPEIVQVRYGQAIMEPDAGVLQVPAYIGKELVTLPGVTCQNDLSATASALLGAGVEFEANYLFYAYGMGLPATSRITAALAVLSDRGQPAVSMA